MQRVARYQSKRKSTGSATTSPPPSRSTDIEIPKVGPEREKPTEAQYYSNEISEVGEYEEFAAPSLYVNREAGTQDTPIYEDLPPKIKFQPSSSNELEIHGYDNIYDTSPVYIDPGQEDNDRYFEK